MVSIREQYSHDYSIAVRKTSGNNSGKGNSFKVLLLVSISRLNDLIPFKQLCNSENLGKFDQEPTSG